MAEATERFIQNTQPLLLLLNFSESKFAGLSQVKITKNEVIDVPVDCVDEHNQLANWLESKLRLSRYRYDPNSDMCPTDEQTLLNDKRRFDKTSHRCQGRTVYKEIDTNRYWYVDNFHKSYDAHLEVFDANGQHLGEASPDGEIDYSKQDLTKGSPISS